MRVCQSGPGVAFPLPKGRPVPEQSKQNTLQNIRQAIGQHGRITYRQLMEIMLFEGNDGFYTRHLNIGRGPNDHFSTRPIDLSPYYGQAFARTIANFLDTSKLKGRPLELVALGDGTGVFLQDILTELRSFHRINKRLKTTSVELVPRFADQQRDRLAKFGVRVVAGSAVDLDRHLSPFSGVVFANELFDQFPVNKIFNLARELHEVYLTIRDDRIIEQLGPFSDPLIEEYFKITRKSPNRGDACVINLDAFRLLDKLGKLMTRGIFLIIDYNVHGWRLNSVPYSRFGGKEPLNPDNLGSALGRDVTTDVDFSAIIMLAPHCGFEVLREGSDIGVLSGYLPQSFYEGLDPNTVLVLEKK